MAETCGWQDCRSSEVQAHHETRQCLACGRHTNMLGEPVEWHIIPEVREWRVAAPVTWPNPAPATTGSTSAPSNNISWYVQAQANSEEI